MVDSSPEVEKDLCKKDKWPNSNCQNTLLKYILEKERKKSNKYGYLVCEERLDYWLDVEIASSQSCQDAPETGEIVKSCKKASKQT